MSELKKKQTFHKSTLPKKCKLSINKEVLQNHNANAINIKSFQKQAQFIKNSFKKPKELIDSLKEIKILKENTMYVISDRYNTYERDYNIFMIDLLLLNKNCKVVSIFKDHLIFDNTDEFLRRIYRKIESSDKIGKIANHYRNYLLFFCKPFFKELNTNAILIGYGDMKAELFYKNNYVNKNDNQNNQNGFAINTEFSIANYENIKTLFNATVREDIDKTFITRTVAEEKGNVIVHTKEKESFVYNSHRGDYSYNLNSVKSGLISRRSHDNSIENILNNLDENYSNINERIIDKIQKNKKTLRNNYSTTDKTKPEENNFNSNAKLKHPLKDKEDDLNCESKKIFTTNKSTHCLFNSTKNNNHTVRHVINPEYTLSKIKCMPPQKNKINIKLKYKDVKELMSDKSPLGENNNIKFSSKINEYKELNLKKNQMNVYHYNKSCDPKHLEYSNKNVEQNLKKNHSTKISEKNPSLLFININSEKNQKEQGMNRATRNINSINTLKSTITLIPKKDRVSEKKSEENKSENKLKEIINNPQLNITKSIFSHNVHLKSTLYSSNNINVACAKLLNKKDININNYHSHSNINVKNSRNQKHSIYKNYSNFDLTNPQSETHSNKLRANSKGKCNSNELNKIDKIIYNSCINLQQGSEKDKSKAKSKESRSLSKKVNNFIKEKINEFLEKDKKKINSYKKNRSTSRNENHNLLKQTTTIINNQKTSSKINLEIDKIVKQVKLKPNAEFKSDIHSYTNKNNNSSSKIRVPSYNKKKE